MNDEKLQKGLTLSKKIESIKRNIEQAQSMKTSKDKCLFIHPPTGGWDPISTLDIVPVEKLLELFLGRAKSKLAEFEMEFAEL